MMMARPNWRARVRQHAGHGGAVAQIQVPVVWAGDGQAVGSFDGGHGGFRGTDAPFYPLPAA